MSTYKTEGIIIKRNNFGEASLLLRIYTEDYGKIESVAKSARKAKGKLKGHLELFLDTDLVLAYGRNIDTVTSSLAIENFFNLRNNLEFSFGAYYILELVDKMTIEGHSDERIFCLLKESLLFLDWLADKELSLRVSRNDRNNSVTTRVELSCGIVSSLRGAFRNNINCLVLFFQTNLLNLTGFSPELNKCVLCGKTIKSGKNYFSFSMGGVVGSECGLRKKSTDQKSVYNLHPVSTYTKRQRSQQSVPMDDNTIKFLRLFQFNGGDVKEYNLHLKKNFEILKKLKIEEKLVLSSVFLMNNFIEFSIERKIKGIDFLRGV